MIYSEGAVKDLLDTLKQLCGTQTTIFLAGELRNGEIFKTSFPFFHANIKFTTLFGGVK